MNPRIIREVSQIFSFNPKDFEMELNALERVRTHDEYTYLHSVNVARLSVDLGRRLELTAEQLVDLGWAALLHDIGKIQVPISVLNKMKKFTSEELAVMRSHPVESLIEMARTTPLTLERLRRLAAAFEHHQRYDLQGYPSVHQKLNLHPYSRIVTIADTFDAMTTDRIYQRRILPDVALKIMSQGFGTVFDPLVLQAFITGMGGFPVGSLVVLSNEDLGVVVKYDKKSLFDRPIILIVKPKSHALINLMDENYSELRILKSEFPEDHEVSTSEAMEIARRRMGTV